MGLSLFRERLRPLEILDRTHQPQVTGILAGAVIASLIPLPLGHMWHNWGQTTFNCDRMWALGQPKNKRGLSPIFPYAVGGVNSMRWAMARLGV